jgi:hypothetical protein
MNAIFNINKFVGVCFGVALLGFGLYKGLGAAADARNKVVRSQRKQIETRYRECVESLANPGLTPGLNGEYPADGPMADFYRQQQSSGNNWPRIGR